MHVYALQVDIDQNTHNKKTWTGSLVIFLV